MSRIVLKACFMFAFTANSNEIIFRDFTEKSSALFSVRAPAKSPRYKFYKPKTHFRALLRSGSGTYPRTAHLLPV